LIIINLDYRIKDASIYLDSVKIAQVEEGMRNYHFFLFPVLVLLIFTGCTDSGGPVITPPDPVDFAASFVHHADNDYYPGEKITFIAYVTPISFTDIAKYEWDWDDGSETESFEVPAAEHVYSGAGTYKVKLVVTDIVGRISESIESIEVFHPGSQPVSQFTFDAPNGWQPGSMFYFDASGSFDVDGVISTYTWDFGDGSMPKSTASTEISHVFDIEGEVEVRLIVEDDTGWAITSDPQPISLGYPDGTRALSSVPLINTIHDLAISGDHIYVANDHMGLQVIDIGNPEEPELLPGWFNTEKPARDVATYGNRVVTASWDMAVSGIDDTVVDFIDITDPDYLVHVSSFTIEVDEVNDIALFGTHAYTTGGNMAIRVIDFTDPDNPELANYINEPDEAWDITVHDEHLYARTSNAVRIFSLEDPVNPTLVAEFRDGTRSMQEVYLSGSRMYATTGYKEWLNIIDISNPGNPVTLAAHDLKKTDGICVTGDTLMGSYSSEPGLSIYDISDINFPELVGCVVTTRYPRHKVASGDYVFFADGLRVSVVNFGEPYGPRLSVGIGGGSTNQDVDFVGNYAYVTGVPYALEIIDLTDPSSPWIIGSCFSPDWIGAKFDNIKVVDDIAYVTGDEYLMIFDVSDPSHPTLKGSANNNHIRGLDVQGKYAYVGSYYEILSIYDIEDPSRPILMSTIAETYRSFYPNALEVRGDYAYMVGYADSAQTGVVAVIDISDPSNPQYITDLALGRYCNQVGISGDNLCVLYTIGSNQSSKLEIFDISDPESPKFVSSLVMPSDTRDMYVVGNYAYITIYDAGLVTVDFTDPSVPFLTSQVDLYTYTYNVAVRGNLAVAVGESHSDTQLYSIVELW